MAGLGIYSESGLVTAVLGGPTWSPFPCSAIVSGDYSFPFELAAEKQFANI